ncbi:HNH endonuclease domain-containing protein [Pigmentiphaga litoralis]|uniref:HNH endonuclease domain-containing protein n=1 Tax=Pigmentiphaga litoralis TaxID=516702 RepID=UPI00167588BC|nr:HNH endonuclease domain-containing protein [Pigmentiphaga litoralis]
MANFLEYQPTRENYWRSIVLFGRNVASYKFALAHALLELRDQGSDFVSLEDLSEPFARHLCGHLKAAPKQSTSSSSRYLSACAKFNSGELSAVELHVATQRFGFNNVLDAFHVVNQQPTNVRFFVDERKINGGIRLTEELLSLKAGPDRVALIDEIDARWRLVETAWDLGLSKQLIRVEHDDDAQFLWVLKDRRRISVTSSRAALNGYQKGRCFYCFQAISITNSAGPLADVDHFIPHVTGRSLPRLIVDGVWNLVLACRDCNRGSSGKFARLPTTGLLERLHQRNEFLISSHHPLRETLIAQTGATDSERRSFLQAIHSEAKANLIHVWEPPQRGDQTI